MPSSTYISNAYGSIPVAPPITSTAPGATSGAITQGNLVYNQLPGYADSLANIGANIGSMSRGEVPTDVTNLLARQAAERGIATGSPGSPNSNASYLQALGLTSLGLQNQAVSTLGNVLPLLPGAAISQNPNFYPSTGQQYEADLQKAIFAAAPDPAQAAAAKLGAASSGYNAGAGAFMGGGGLPYAGLPSTDSWWNAPDPNRQVVAGSQGTGSYYGDFGYLTSPPSQTAVADVLKKYAPPAWDNTYGWSESEGGLVPTTGGGYTPDEWNDWMIGAYPAE